MPTAGSDDHGPLAVFLAAHVGEIHVVVGEFAEQLVEIADDGQVDASADLPKTVLVGLPEQSVRESIHRIERALAKLGYERPNGRTVINLAPGDLPNNASAFDFDLDGHGVDAHEGRRCSAWRAWTATGKQR